MTTHPLSQINTKQPSLTHSSHPSTNIPDHSHQPTNPIFLRPAPNLAPQTPPAIFRPSPIPPLPSLAIIPLSATLEILNNSLTTAPTKTPYSTLRPEHPPSPLPNPPLLTPTHHPIQSRQTKSTHPNPPPSHSHSRAHIILPRAPYSAEQSCRSKTMHHVPCAR